MASGPAHAVRFGIRARSPLTVAGPAVPACPTRQTTSTRRTTMVKHAYAMLATWASDKPDDILSAYLDCRAFADKRTPQHEFDFGDPATVMKRLKRVDVNWMTTSEDEVPVFGIFGGEVKGRWIVWVSGCALGRFYLGLSTASAMPMRVRLVLGYDTLEALKHDWQLD